MLDGRVMFSLGNFILKAPRGGSFSLQQRCLWALTHNYVENINQIKLKYTLQRIDDVCRKTRKQVLSSLSKLPTELVQSVVDHLCSALNESVAFVVIVALLTTSKRYGQGLQLKLNLNNLLSSNALLRLIKTFNGGLVEFRAMKERIDDNHLLALAASDSAVTLKTLEVDGHGLTENSASAWTAFSALERLRIWDPTAKCSIGIKTLRAISRLPVLSELVLDSFIVRIKEKHFYELFGPDRLLYLDKLELRLDPFFVEGKLPPEKMIEHLAQSHPRMRAVYLGASAFPEPYRTKLHTMFPYLASLRAATSEFEIQSPEMRALLALCGHVTNLRVPSEVRGVLSREDYLTLAQHLTGLERLQIEPSPEGQDYCSDFRMFSTLKELEIKIFNGDQPDVKLPTQLQVLKIEFHRETFTDYRRLLRRVSKLAQLTDLRMFVAKYKADTPPVYEELCQTLSRLTRLTSIHFEGIPIDPVLPLPMIQLPYLDNAVLRPSKAHCYSAATLYLPSMTSTNGLSLHVWDQYTPENLPNLIEYRYYLTGRFESPTQEKALLKKFRHQLRSIDGMRAFSGLKKFKNLTDLILRDPVCEKEAAKLLQSLPTLQHLSLFLSTGDELPDWDWLNHKELRKLEIKSGIPSSKEEEKTSDNTLFNAPQRIHTFLVSPKTFPALNTLSFSFSTRIVENIHVVDSELLGSLKLRMQPGALNRSNLKIINCSALSRLDLSDFMFDSLEILNLPKLSFLWVQNCTLPTASDKIRFQKPPMMNNFRGLGFSPTE